MGAAAVIIPPQTDVAHGALITRSLRRRSPERAYSATYTRRAPCAESPGTS